MGKVRFSDLEALLNTSIQSDESAGGLAPENVSGSSSHVTNIDTMDQELYDDVSVDNSHVVSMKVEHPEQAFEDLLEDGFGCFYKYAPRVLPDQEVRGTRKLNRRVIQEMVDLPEYQQLRKYTRGDEINSIGALSVLKKTFENVPEDVRNQQKEVEKQSQCLSDILEDPKISPNSPEGKQIIQGQSNALGESVEALSGGINANVDQIRQAIRQALKEAAEEAENTSQAAQVFGWGNEFGDLNQVPVEQRVELASSIKNLEWMRKLAALAGRFIHIAEKKQAEKVTYDWQIIEGIERGDSIPDVVPEEFVKLFGDPDMELLFLKQFAEQDLQQYRLIAREAKGKGPIMIRSDCSGSMDGLPDLWAKAVGLALFMIARKQHRHFSGAVFNTSIKARINVPANVTMGLQDIIQFFGCGTSGGTNFEVPLTDCLEELKKAEAANSPVKDSDLIFITDGACDVSDEFLSQFLAEKKRLGFNVYSVLIGVHVRSLAVLNKFSDKVFNLEGDYEANQDKVFDTAFTI